MHIVEEGVIKVLLVEKTGAWVYNRLDNRDFCVLLCSDWLWGPQSLLLMASGGFFTWANLPVCENYHSVHLVPRLRRKVTLLALVTRPNGVVLAGRGQRRVFIW